MTPKSSNTELSEGSYPKPSLAWALFALWRSHIPRYAPSPKDKNPSNPATPEALKFYEMGSKHEGNYSKYYYLHWNGVLIALASQLHIQALWEDLNDSMRHRISEL